MGEAQEQGEEAGVRNIFELSLQMSLDLADSLE